MSESDQFETPIIGTKKTGLSGFLQQLAGYYSQFLETDFKAIREPKRKYTEKRAGQRVGVHLSHYPDFKINLIECLNEARTTSLKIRYGAYTASLPKSITSGIYSAIQSIDNTELLASFESIKNRCIDSSTHGIDDFELFAEEIVQSIHKAISHLVVNRVTTLISPIIARQSGASAAISDIESYSREIVELITYEHMNSLMEAIGSCVYQKVYDDLAEVLKSISNSDQLRLILSNYFENFASRDLFVELRELLGSQTLAENTQIYLNIGEVLFKKSKFPIYYVPLDVVIESDFISLDIGTSIYANKKLINYLLGQIKKEHSIKSINPLTERIFHKIPDESYFDVILSSFHKVLAALNVEGDISLKSPGITKAKKYGLTVSNELTLTLFDKSDESIVNDYEALMLGLEEDNPLVKAFKNIIEAFLTTNPVSVEPVIDREWDDTSTSDRLVFQSPMPLAEEQRKVLSALRQPDTKFVIVEGPPGTGKSHTITAIAFEMILKGQNILILSDKKEALDVVESKINTVISKARGGDDEFVNPILRLGKTDSNYSNIIKRASVDKLKISVQTFKSNKSRFDNQFSNLEGNLKDSVKSTISAVESIGFDELIAFHKAEEHLFDKYPELDDLSEESEKQFLLLAKVLKTISSDRVRFSKICVSTENAKLYLSLLQSIRSVDQNIKRLIQKYPDLNVSNTPKLKDYLREIYDSKFPVFGYLFAGKNLRRIGKLIEMVTGRYNPKPQLILKELEVLASLPKILKIHLESNGKSSDHMLDLTDFIAIGNPLGEGDAETLYDFLSTEWLSEVSNILPTTIKELLETDIRTVQLLHDTCDLIEKKEVLKEKFDSIPDFDYLQDKTQFEQMNTMKLVHTIDERVTLFAVNNKADAKTLQQIIRNKEKFPIDKFGILKEAFPCIIAGLRDYAEFIPLESDLFDLVIIDEASQVSIAQAMPAILRAKKVLVLGDRRQFGNVKTQNASKHINSGYFQEVMNSFREELGHDDISQQTRMKNFNITHSVMDFFELANNFTIQLKKHFRGYPEMISFSSKYVYTDGLQALKIRGKQIEDVLEFVEVKNIDRIEPIKNTNRGETDLIIMRLNKLLEEDVPPSVAIITPFRDQVTYLQKRLSDQPNQEELFKRLKLAVFTFDTCQGEERDIILYSMVASRHSDALNYIFPRELKISEDEIDGNLKFQRLNVGFSRGKEKLIFILSKPIEEFSGSVKMVLKHYQQVLEQAKSLPTSDMVDQSSPMEIKVLEWLKATSFVNKNLSAIEIIPQFKLGEYLKSLNPAYSHPAYKVDFLIRLNSEDAIHQCIVEYDGFEHHFDVHNNIDNSNWRSYLTAGDVERECVLESYGYKMLRINRFNVGGDPVKTLDNRLHQMFEEFAHKDTNHKIVDDIACDIAGLGDGSMKQCPKCETVLPIEKFADSYLKSGYGRYCKQCKGGRKPHRRKTW